MAVKLPKRYSPGEEISHAITHGIGVLLSIAALVIMVVFASLRGNAWHVVGSAIFGASLVILYTSSTFYHALTAPRAKFVFNVLDHAAIYILIAGTYTPFTLVSLRGGWGWTLFGLVWGLAVLGMLKETLLRGRYRAVSLILYLGMGWLITIAIAPLIRNLDSGGLLFLMLGGAAYTVGVVFYLWGNLRWHHFIWHLFVLAGSIMHFFAVLLYVIPGA